MFRAIREGQEFPLRFLVALDRIQRPKSHCITNLSMILVLNQLTNCCLYNVVCILGSPNTAEGGASAQFALVRSGRLIVPAAPSPWRPSGDEEARRRGRRPPACDKAAPTQIGGQPRVAKTPAACLVSPSPRQVSSKPKGTIVAMGWHAQNVKALIAIAEHGCARRGAISDPTPHEYKLFQD
eukprot:2857239-Pyramimonas_sp.AAC.1